MRACRVRNASMLPLIPSPGRPNTTRTPQSISRSTRMSAVVVGMGAYGARSTPGHSLLPFEDPRDRPDELLPRRSPVPRRSLDLTRARHVRGQVAHDARGHSRVAEGDVHFVVVLEGSIVRVGGTDHGPEIVDDQRLQVRHPRLVLEDPDATAEQLSVQPPA